MDILALVRVTEAAVPAPIREEAAAAVQTAIHHIETLALVAFVLDHLWIAIGVAVIAVLMLAVRLIFVAHSKGDTG
jgi:uncharacterized membrane protein